MRALFQVAIAVALVACSSESVEGASGAPVGGAMAAAQAGAIQPVALPNGVTRIQPVDILDARGFERPMVAIKALIPAGWRTQGGIEWNVGDPCQAGDYYLNWSITSPDGASVLAVVPQPMWVAVRAQFPLEPGKCSSGNWTNVRDYLQALAQRTSPQGRILDFRPRPDLGRPLQDMLSKLTPLNTSTMQVQNRVESGEILIASTLNGVEMRESITATVMFANARFADLMNPGQISMETLQAVPTEVVFMRAPAGQLQLTLPGTIAKSMRRMREWNDRVYAHSRKKQQDNFEAAIRAGNISLQRLEEMKALHAQSMRNLDETRQYNDRLYDIKNVTSDRNQREFIESVRGVETYHEPVEGGAVQLDNTYDHAWRLRDGTYLLTDDPNFRPGKIGLEGQEMQRVQ
jgi:hypothetical protein